MAKPLQSASIAAPGFFGLNTQESSVTLASGFALKAENCVIDKYGRLGARKGYSSLYDKVQIEASFNYTSSTVCDITDVGHGITQDDIDAGKWIFFVVYDATGITILDGGLTNQITLIDADTIRIEDIINPALAGQTLTGYLEYALTEGYFSETRESFYRPIDFKGGYTFTDINGQKYEGFWSDSKFFMEHSSGLVREVSYSGSNVFSQDGWQAQTLNDAAFLFNNNYEPIYFSPTTGVLDDIVNVGHGTAPKGNTVLSAYGRLWCANTDTNKTTVYWSDLLDGTNWQSGTAGSLDISSVLVGGNDEIIALGAQAGRLIIFCTHNVIIYDSPPSSIGGGEDQLDPTSMSLVEVINNVGCVARDSVQSIGSDIVFLSKDGLRSLGRLIQEKSQPMRDLSKNIRDTLVRETLGVDNTKIRSIYIPEEAQYLLLTPHSETIYCFDTRSAMQDGSLRVTTWSKQKHLNMVAGKSSVYFVGSGYIAEHSGYSDNGEPYKVSYLTNYIDFDNSTSIKMFKKLAATVIGGSNQELIFKTATDYYDIYNTYAVSLDSSSSVSEYGIAEYGIGTYSTGTLTDSLNSSVGGSGTVLQAGIDVTISNSPFSIQRLDIYIKEGKTI